METAETTVTLPPGQVESWVDISDGLLGLLQQENLSMELLHDWIRERAHALPPKIVMLDMLTENAIKELGQHPQLEAIISSLYADGEVTYGS